MPRRQRDRWSPTPPTLSDSPAASVGVPPSQLPPSQPGSDAGIYEAASPESVGSVRLPSNDSHNRMPAYPPFAPSSGPPALSRASTPVTQPLPSPPSSPPRIHNDLYYFDDGNVVFQVHNVLYRVHKYFFKSQSPIVFGKIFNNLSTTDPDMGSVDGHPIRLDYVSPYEFEALLEFMYCAIFTGGPSSFDSWAAILHVSNMWRFDAIKAQAIKRIDTLEGLSPVDKIILAEKSSVEEWYLPAYTRLVERSEPISTYEARKLISLGEKQVGQVIGMDIPALLAQARERHHKPPRKFSLPAASIVEELFGQS